MIKTQIKICGLRDRATATLAVKAGVRFIGIIFHPDSRRFVKISDAIPLSAAIRKAGGIPVAVFSNHTANEMKMICEKTNIEVIQLHGSVSRKEHHLLSDHYCRFYVRPVTSLGEVIEDQENNLRNCFKSRDYLLYDHIDSGKGNSFNFARFQPEYSQFNFFVAGGIHSGNVGTVIRQLFPFGVDLSSGVENNQGVKDSRMILEFIRSVEEINNE